MKRFFILLTTILTSMLVLSCGSPNPENVAKKFLYAYYTGDFETAKTYCDVESARTLNYVIAMSGEEEIAEMQKSKPTIKITDVKIQDEDEKAVVKAEIIGVDGKSEDETVTLFKEDGKWLVYIAK